MTVDNLEVNGDATFYSSASVDAPNGDIPMVHSLISLPSSPAETSSPITHSMVLIPGAYLFVKRHVQSDQER